MSKFNALVADDVSSLRALLKTHLKKFDCSVVKEVEDGSKVISAIEKTMPNIVFLDINMPGQDGLSILKTLSEQGIHRDVWMISGETDKETKEKALQYGARGFIEKPFTLLSLEKVFADYRAASNTIRDNVKNRSVLIADDEPLMRELLKGMLSKMDCDINYEASTGSEVLEVLRSDKLPEVIFLDIEMPEKTGLEIVEIIRRESIPVFSVIVSAHGTFENVQTAMNAGADGFVVKPYSQKKIEQALAKFDKTKKN